MKGLQQPDVEPALPEEVRAAAACWVAQLHDEERHPDLEARVDVWLGESDQHRLAFARLTRAWERAGKLQSHGSSAVSGGRVTGGREAARAQVRTRRHVAPWATLVAATLVLAVGAAVYTFDDHAIVSGIGERRVRLLPDGTRVALNTNTRIEVNYKKAERRIRLVRGEARFDVAEHANWPFVVSVDGEEIRALGTSFIVRHEDASIGGNEAGKGGDADVAITLVEGRISVATGAGNDAAVSSRIEDAVARTGAAELRDSQAPAAEQILAPGERLLISRQRGSSVDRPDLTRLTAWQQGRVEYDATPLAEAVTEMNRYSKSHIVVLDSKIAGLRIGGVFRAGDRDEFVRIVAAAFALKVERRGDDIVLSRLVADFDRDSGNSIAGVQK